MHGNLAIPRLFGNSVTSSSFAFLDLFSCPNWFFWIGNVTVITNPEEPIWTREGIQKQMNNEPETNLFSNEGNFNSRTANLTPRTFHPFLPEATAVVEKAGTSIFRTTKNNKETHLFPHWQKKELPVWE
jgi:hypothetical protein